MYREEGQDENFGLSGKQLFEAQIAVSADRDTLMRVPDY